MGARLKRDAGTTYNGDDPGGDATNEGNNC